MTLPLFDRPGVREDDEKREQPILRVSEINRVVRASLEAQWRDVWIEGELSDVRKAPSGHVYFCLNDEDEPAQLTGVMFRGDARRAKARLARGEVVRMRGTLTLYEPRGTFQLVARVALPAGEGDLHAQFQRVQKKLEAEGLLAPESKRKLPAMPSVVGVVTSAAGAAMHDIIRVARRRCPVRIVVADCRVQGQDAPASIVAAMRRIVTVPGLDVVIVGRGGGSQEDLWAFNHESVARAIAACVVPTVSAVGHEVDVTIADLVADVRASTPSNAAELVVPDRQALWSELDGYHRRVERALETRIGKLRLRFERLEKRLHDPRHALGGVRRRLDSLRRDLGRRGQARVAADRSRLTALQGKLSRLDPRRQLAHDRASLQRLTSRLEAAAQPMTARRARALHEIDTHLRALARPTVSRRARALDELGTRLRSIGRPMLAGKRAKLDGVRHRLDALSPRAVLSRGYAIVLHEGQALMAAARARDGDGLHILLHEGELDATVSRRWKGP